MLSINSVIWNASTIHVCFFASDNLICPLPTFPSVGQLRMDSPFSWDGKGPWFSMLTWHSNRQPKNTRKGDSKQIVTQITGQRHTEVRVEMALGREKWCRGFQVFFGLWSFREESRVEQKFLMDFILISWFLLLVAYIFLNLYVSFRTINTHRNGHLIDTKNG